MTCLACGCNNLLKFRNNIRDDNIGVYKCNECGHSQLDIDKIDSSFYDENKQLKSLYEVIDINKIYEKSKFDINRRIELVRFIIDGDIRFMNMLEIGSGYGFFINEMKKYCNNINGVEIGRERREESIFNYNINVYGNDLITEYSEDFTNKYDVIMMFQTLEHIINPFQFLNNVYKMLRNSGYLIIEVPNNNDYLLKLSKEYNDFHYQKAHISYFNKVSILTLLDRCGFSNPINCFTTQRYSVDNYINWLINKKSQIFNEYLYESRIKWLNAYFKKELEKSGKADTLIVVARKI